MKVRAHILSLSVARGVAILCAAVVVAGMPSMARAAGVVGSGSAASCTDAALNTALAGGGLVTFDCGGPATIDVSTGTGTKTITADTTIDGGSLITISGGNAVGVFSISGVKFTVENLTIAHGNSAGQGGAISNGGGTVTVNNSTLTGNRASDGGGIATTGDEPVTITNSTFTGNSVDGCGGGILNLGLLTVTNSTFTNNSAGGCGGMGGGIFQTGNQSSFVGRNGRSAVNLGGNPTTVTNSTFTGNNGSGIGVTSAAGAVLLRNTIVVASRPSGGNCSGAITDGGHNLDDGTSCGFSTANGSLSNTDPQLDPAGLQDNGGPTQTVALCTAVGLPAGCAGASRAIEAGDQTVCAASPANGWDQRGLLRPGSGHTNCSIGAYEADASVPEACSGDCGGSQRVAVNDLITLVNVALGNFQPAACLHGVPSGGGVNVAMLVQAVANALDGCPAPLTQCGNGAIDGDEECDDGNTVGGDGCAANCTREDRRPYPITAASISVQTEAFAFPLSLSGQEILTTGRARASSGAGVLPVVIRADDVQFAPIRLLNGLGCLCLRAIAAPELGPGLAGRGEIGCGAQGLPDVDVAARRDHDSNDIDPSCATGFLEDGSAEHPHAGVCNGLLQLGRSGGSGPRGSALITMSLAVGIIADGGTCATVPPNTPAAPEGPDGIPCTADDPSQGAATTLLATTGTARAEVLDANDFAGDRIGSDDQCGGPCVVAATGVPFDCDALAAQPRGGVASGRLVSAAPLLDVPALGDIVNTGAPFPLRDFPSFGTCDAGCR